MRRVIAGLVVALTVLTGCGKATTDVPRKTVVASIFPLFEAASYVGGSKMLVSNLSPLDPFGSLTSKQELALRNADLAVILGKGTQPQVERVANERVGPTLRVLDLMQTKLVVGGETPDPYVWLDPNHMDAIVVAVRDAMSSLDSANATTYRKKATSTRGSLRVLDRRIATMVETCDRKDVVTTRPDYQYLTERYGLNQVPATDDQLMEAAVTIYRPETVYFNDLPSLKDADAFTNRYDARVSTLDPIAIQTDQARRGGSSYWSMMDLDLAALRVGLGCEKVTVKLNKSSLEML